MLLLLFYSLFLFLTFNTQSHTYMSVQRIRTTPMSIGKFHIRTYVVLTHLHTALCDSEIRFFPCVSLFFFREKKLFVGYRRLYRTTAEIYKRRFKTTTTARSTAKMNEAESSHGRERKRQRPKKKKKTPTNKWKKIHVLWRSVVTHQQFCALLKSSHSIGTPHIYCRHTYICHLARWHTSIIFNYKQFSTCLLAFFFVRFRLFGRSFVLFRYFSTFFFPLLSVRSLVLFGVFCLFNIRKYFNAWVFRCSLFYAFHDCILNGESSKNEQERDRQTFSRFSYRFCLHIDEYEIVELFFVYAALFILSVEKFYV